MLVHFPVSAATVHCPLSSVHCPFSISGAFPIAFLENSFIFVLELREFSILEALPLAFPGSFPLAFLENLLLFFLELREFLILEAFPGSSPLAFLEKLLRDSKKFFLTHQKKIPHTGDTESNERCGS